MMFKMTSVISFLLLAGVYGSVISAKSDGPISTNLKLVATVDGKSFFGDRSVIRIWRAAKEYCENLGMELAQITSQAQANALRAAYGPDFIDGHWTSGRDVHSPRQFVWNSDGAEITDHHLELRNFMDTDYQTCVFFWSRANNDSALYYSRCDREDGTLCST